MFGIKLGKIKLLKDIKSRELIGLDFNGDTLKMVHGRHVSDTVEILDLSASSIAGMPDDEISAVIANSVKGLKAKNAEIISSIPSNIAITKNIELPSTNPKEIREIINLQIGRHTPYSREEIVSGYIETDVTRHSYTKVILVIVARHVLKRQLLILSKAGLMTEKIFFMPETLAQSASRIFKLESKDTPVGIVHVDEAFSDFDIVFRNKIMFVRSVPIGAQNLMNEREKFAPKFTEELKRTLEAFYSENVEKKLDMLVLTGAVDEAMKLDADLREHLQLNVKTMPYLKNLLLSDTAKSNLESLAKHLSFLNTISLLMASADVKINLIPDEVKLKIDLESRGRELIKTGILAFAVFILVCFILISGICFKGLYLRELDVRYKKIEGETKSLESKFAGLNAIRSHLASRGYSLEILTELHNITPEDVALDDIRYEGKGPFSVRGTAESMSSVFYFVNEMRKSVYFKDVKTKYTTKRRVGDKDVTDFEIAATLDKRPAP